MRNIVIIVLGSMVMAVGFNLFIIPHQILSGGLSGIAMMLGIVTPINTGILNLLLNLPLLIIGVLKLGKQFITLYNYFGHCNISFIVLPSYS